MSDRRDPTRSAGLRKRGRALVNRRVHSLQQRLRQALKEHDVAGLRDVGPAPPIGFVNWAAAVSYRLARSEGAIAQIVEQTLTTPPDWPRELIERSIAHGVALVEQELRISLEHLDTSEIDDLHARAASVEVRGIAGETERRVLRNVVRAIETKMTPDELIREVRSVLEKITRLRLFLMVNTGVVRAVNAGKLFAYESEGIRQVGVEPEWLPDRHTHQRDHMASDHHHRGAGSTWLVDARSRKAKRRKRVKANKAKRKRSIEEEILLAALTPSQGAAFLAIEGVLEEVEERVSLVNVLTAGDDKVCEDCEDIAAEGPYDIDTARGLIPAHPNCRCAFIPFGDKRFAPIEEQLEEFE